MDTQSPLIPTYPETGSLLAGKIILITGATAGIGKALSFACAKQGAQLILLGRNSRKLEAVADEIDTVTTHPCLLYPLNLETANNEHYEQLATNIATQCMHLDGLVHNAANLGNLSPIKQYSPQQWYKVMQTNVNAPFLLTQSCLPLLERANQASIIWTSSGIAQTIQAYWGAYGVSKAANEYMMHLLAMEYEGSNIRSNAVLPGVVATGMRAKAFPAENPNTLAKPSTILNAWLYLLSDDSLKINGSILSAQ